MLDIIILLWYNRKYGKLECYRSLASVSIGREDFARTFVHYAVGTNADRRFARACPREELPSFAIGLLKDTATAATGAETKKIKGFSVGFIVVRFFR